MNPAHKAMIDQVKADARAVLDTPAGARLLCHLVTFCGVDESSFTGNSTTFFNEGKRAVGLYLKDLLGLRGLSGAAALSQIGGDYMSTMQAISAIAKNLQPEDFPHE